MITWVDLRNGNYNIYAQKYNSLGIPLDSNFKVNNTVAGQKIFPAITVHEAGSFIITWSGQSIKWDIFAQTYDSTCTPIGFNFEVNDKAGSAGKGGPAISTRNDGNFIITWSDNRNGNPNIYAQRYNISGNPLGHNFKVNVDMNSDQEYPVISVDGSGNFVITWMDERNGNRDIYAQRYNSMGALLGSNFKVSDDAGNAWQESPAIATDGFGNFIITWEDTRDDNRDIYAQRYSSSGIPLGANFKVHNTGTAWQWFPDVAADESGNFVIAWHDYRNGTYNADIYVQRYNLDGDILGSNFKVSDDTGTGWQGFPAVAMDKFGNFIITWMDNRQGNYDIYAQRYDSFGNPLSSNFRVNDDDGSGFQAYPAIGIDNNRNFVITWHDSRSNYPDIYGQRYDSSGNPLGFNFKANDDDGNNYQGYPAVTMDGSGNFIITWTDSRNGDYDVYAQRYNSSGNPVGSNYLVPNSQYSSCKQLSPAVASNNSNIYFTWMDNRRDKGWDIYAKVVDWDWTEVKENQNAGLPNRFELSQNYPNPFNPTTRIQFRVGSLETPSTPFL